ncbi:metallophosphoesterase [Candidatus Babeliales bacterium]|nr:metallophosphoesterase [Candidatus Babeliales bacterium]MCF7899506.1 metallophosphoesterase [Candidatus Babeliales bacterium]
MYLHKKLYLMLFLLLTLNIKTENTKLGEPFSFVVVSDVHSMNYDNSVIDNNPEYYINFSLVNKLPQRINVIDQIIGTVNTVGFSQISGAFSQIDIDNTTDANFKYRMAAIDFNDNLYLGNLDFSDNFICTKTVNNSVRYIATKNGKTWLLSTENTHGGYKIYTDDTKIFENLEKDYIKINGQSCAPTWHDSWRFLKPNEATIQFEAKAAHDVIVMLSPDKSTLSDFPAYTFVISGWAEQAGIGTRTILRTVNGNVGGFELGQSTYFISSENMDKFLPYWIKLFKLDNGSTNIILGQSSEIGENIILNCIDNNPSANGLSSINHFGISSWNVPVTYKNIKISTTESFFGKFAQPIWNDDWQIKQNGITTIKFKAKATNDVFLLLSPNKSTDQNFASYTFVIRGWAQTKTVLRDHNYTGVELVTKESATGDPVILGDLSQTELKEFCLTIDRTNSNQITLELSQGANTIITYTDTDPASRGLNNIKYFGISSWNVPVTFDDIQITNSLEPVTYSANIGALSCLPIWNDAWQLPRADSGAIKFKAKALHDVIVMLSPDKSTLTSFPAYTFVISGWADQTGIGTRTVLRKGNGGGIEMGASGYFISSEDTGEFIPYWITINKIDGGKTAIKLGQGETINKNVILSCVDPNPASNNLNNIQYFGISSWNVPVEYTDISIENAPVSTRENLEQAGFRQIQGGLTQIALGSAPEYWGVNTENRVFKLENSEWFQPTPSAILRQLTIGQYGCIWATATDNTIWQLERPTNTWYRVFSGLLKKVVLDNFNVIWGIGQDNCIYRATNNTSCYPSWKKMSDNYVTDIAVKDSTDIYMLTNESLGAGYKFYVNNKDLSKNVKAVIVPGDFTTPGDTASLNRFISDWEQPLNQALKYTDGGLYVGPGNHDNDACSYLLFTDALTYLSNKYGYWFYSFDINGVHFSCVGCYPSSYGLILPSYPYYQGLSRLSDDLDNIDPSTPVVIFFHYPVVGPLSDVWSKSNKDDFYDIIANHNVKLVLTGHTHGSYASSSRNGHPVADSSGNALLVCTYDPTTQNITKSFVDIYSGDVTWDAMYQTLPELNPA